ncbi:MAG: NAD(P)/FAD-dependent oxidoreductase [Rhodoferax sp.]|uniref:NAD(P)/FAD-dependent oxidoreductase n=1 Tax=Rhodoferax sp. TaxID=50421 RepID=UPI001B4638D9|nr:NAD(P)/FAD-dependent oxidoreductase [Rhodoferax sp.]MBP9906417.1 NAD(P)/FAD-dependent oxidoreductase [Rhodoferax sp.]
MSTVIETDALVIGAGPVGLFQVFQLGLQGIKAQVVDVLDEAGGQCIELYADKPIYDIPALPSCTGRQLTQRLLQQIAPFSPDFHFGQQVSALQQTDGRWLATCRRTHTPALQFLTRSVFIAAGVGAFVPKELKVDGLAEFAGTQLFYRAQPPEQFAGQEVLIVGGEDAAVASAITLAAPGPQQARRVTVLHRRDVMQADASALQRFATLRKAGLIHFVAGWVNTIQTRGERLTAVQIGTPDDGAATIPLDRLLVCQGISPKLGPVADWGLAMERKQLCVNPETFATSAPGVYAVGDVVTYPGKKKLIVCGFHEATLAAFAAAQQLYPQDSGVLQYTTSSALLQQRLGVGHAAGTKSP